jgi:hypothetical protein
MPNVPQPKSFSQILGTMVNTFLTGLGLPAIKKGDPSLSVLEAAARSDFRTSNDVLNMLALRNRNNRTGPALDADGADEKVRRIAQSPSNGQVTISDTSFVQVQTRVYQGGTGIAAGALVLTVEDASAFPASGSVYIGRGTTNEEGPFTYTTPPSVSGSAWLITITTPVSNYHQLGETVVLAQGGDRLIPAGTIMQTPAGGLNQVKFRTLFDATIPDGDTQITSVVVQAQTPGKSTCVPAGTIREFVSPPFTGAAVTNPLPFDNGTDTESDDDYRDRIRLAVKSRSKATQSAVVYGLLGAEAEDEAGRIVSVSTSFRPGEPRTIFIDDGTGYEDKDVGVVEEILTGSAVGGEKYFQLANRPVAKAYLESREGPFEAVAGTTLSVLVGGVASSYTFATEDFANASNASASEVVSAINAQPSLLFSARTSNARTKVAIFAKTESEENLRIVDSGANDWLEFSTRPAYTLFLFRNGRLLSEDGQLAELQTLSPDAWGAVSSGATLTISVDGIAQSVTIVDADFAGTAYLTVSQTNSLESWATVLNRKIAGVTATAELGKLRLVSNRGRSNDASLSVTAGTLLSIFGGLQSVTGIASDYVFDRYTAQIRLVSPLEGGDSLTAGSSATRASVTADSDALTIAAGSTSVAAESGAEIWWAVDGGVVFPETSIGVGTTLTWAVGSSPAWGQRISISHASLPVWENAQEGDWIIVTDLAVTQGARGAFRIAEKLSNLSIQIERAAGSPTGTWTLSDTGLVLLRTTGIPPQRLYLPAATYTAGTLASAITASILGTNTEALVTATNASDGQLCIVTTNVAGRDLYAAEAGDVVLSEESHRATVRSGNQVGISGTTATLTGVTNSTTFTIGVVASPSNVLMKFLRPLADGANLDRRHNQDEVRTFEIDTGGTFTVRRPATKEWLVGDRLFYGRGFDLSGRDNLLVNIDDDNESGRYAIDMFRPAKIATFAGTMELTEVGGTSLAQSFGTNWNWNDYAMLFKARTKTHSGPDTNKSVLYRWWRHGPEGVGTRLQYQYPLAASTPIAVESDALNRSVVVRLQSSAVRSVPTFRATSKIGVAITALASNLYTYQFVANFDTSAANRVIRINYSGRGGTPFTIGETVTTASGSAVVSSDTSLGGGTGYLTVTGVVPTISSTQTLTGGTSGVTATATTSPYGYTTLTLVLPGAVTDHGLPVGETVFLTPGDVNFLAGPRRIVAVTTTTISYIDTVATTASSGVSVGSVSYDSGGEVTVSGTSVVTGDIFSGYNVSVLPAVYKRAVKATIAAGGRSWTGQHFEGQAVNTVLAWYSVTGAQFYPLVANTAAQVATAVGTLTGSPVSAVAVGTAGVGTATGVIADATYETTELGGTNPWWDLTDGYNWVRSHNTPATPANNYVMTLRTAVATPLAANADIANEDVRLVPVTAQSVAAWLNSTAVSGLGNRGGAAATGGGEVEMWSSQLGSAGKIQVSGGSANQTSTAVRGSPQAGGPFGSFVKVTVDAVDGLGGLQQVWANNAVANPKAVFDASTEVLSVAANGVVALDSAGTKAWTRLGSLTDNTAVLIEKRGDLVSITGLAPTIGVNTLSVSGEAGDYIRIQSSTTPPSGTTNVNALNQGIYKIVAKSSGIVFIENPSAVEETASIKYDFIAYNSIVPGDTVSFGSDGFGSDNTGARLVTALGATEWGFTLETTQTSLQPYTGTGSPLGANYPLYQVFSAPVRALLGVAWIFPNTDADLMDVVLTPSNQADRLGEVYGTVLTVSNKLAFSGSEAVGLDAYKTNTGLIAEANRIVFGDEQDTANYEGIASAGAAYNISGPVVKRVKMALAIRATVETDDLRRSIQSAVAGVINRSKVGTSVAISDTVAAATEVVGVEAVSILSPLYQSSNDLIVVQPYEKALVTDLSDITITFIGE